MSGPVRPDPAPGAAPPPGDDPIVGTLVAGKYKIQRLIARGGMGRIYLAEQLPLRRTVAFKLLSPRPHMDGDGEFRARFFLEAATLGRLKHPNTVTVFDYGQVEGADAFYMAMEYVDGRTLSQILREEGALHPVRALRVAYEITRSLSEAHELNIVHRDLKPGNVMVGETPEGFFIKVLDFGIAKVLEDNADHVTRADQLIGSPRYMAPEQIRSDTIDTRADQYALGVMLYEMVTGKAPFRGANSVDVLLAHLQQPVPPMAEQTQRPIPPALETLVLRMMRKDPAERFANTRELREALQALIQQLEDGLPLAGMPPDSSSQSRTMPPVVLRGEPESSQNTLERPRPALDEAPPARSRVPLLAVLAALMLLATVLLLVLRPGEAPPAPEAPAAAAVVQLQLLSEPPGATVSEGGQALGQTPLTLPLLSTGAPRTFAFTLEGYAPTQGRQEPSAQDAVLQVRLSPLAPDPGEAPAGADAVAKPPTKAPPPAKTPPPKTPPPPKQDDDLGLRNRR